MKSILKELLKQAYDHGKEFAGEKVKEKVQEILSEQKSSGSSQSFKTPSQVPISTTPAASAPESSPSPMNSIFKRSSPADKTLKNMPEHHQDVFEQLEQTGHPTQGDSETAKEIAFNQAEHPEQTQTERNDNSVKEGPQIS
jgi:hypothetical protein